MICLYVFSHTTVRMLSLYQQQGPVWGVLTRGSSGAPRRPGMRRPLLLSITSIGVALLACLSTTSRAEAALPRYKRLQQIKDAVAMAADHTRETQENATWGLGSVTGPEPPVQEETVQQDSSASSAPGVAKQSRGGWEPLKEWWQIALVVAAVASIMVVMAIAAMRALRHAATGDAEASPKKRPADLTTVNAKKKHAVPPQNSLASARESDATGGGGGQGEAGGAKANEKILVREESKIDQSMKKGEFFQLTDIDLMTPGKRRYGSPRL